MTFTWDCESQRCRCSRQKHIVCVLIWCFVGSLYRPPHMGTSTDSGQGQSSWSWNSSLGQFWIGLFIFSLNRAIWAIKRKAKHGLHPNCRGSGRPSSSQLLPYVCCEIGLLCHLPCVPFTSSLHPNIELFERATANVSLGTLPISSVFFCLLFLSLLLLSSRCQRFGWILIKLL